MGDWFYSFTNYIEYEHEELDSLQKLKDVITFERSQKRISNSLLDWTTEFLTEKFEHRLPLLCNRNYKYQLCGSIADNCFTESENSALARDPLGPKPTYRIHVSCDAILQHTDDKFTRLIADCQRCVRKFVLSNYCVIFEIALTNASYACTHVYLCVRVYRRVCVCVPSIVPCSNERRRKLGRPTWMSWHGSYQAL